MQNFSSPVNLERLYVIRGVGYVNTLLNKTHFLLCENLKQYVYVCVNICRALALRVRSHTKHLTLDLTRKTLHT